MSKMTNNFVLLPGWTQTERSYKKLAAITPKEMSLVVVPYYQVIKNGKVDEFVSNFLKFLDDRHLGRINLVGHSLGGALALEFCLHHPQRIEQLFLIDSAGIYGQETAKELIGNWARNFISRGKTKAANSIKNLPDFLRRMRMYTKLGRYAVKADFSNQAHRLVIPTTIFWGEKDVLTPLWQGQKLHELIRGFRLIVLKDMDHDWMLHSPQAFWQHISS